MKIITLYYVKDRYTTSISFLYIIFILFIYYFNWFERKVIKYIKESVFFFVYKKSQLLL